MNKTNTASANAHDETESGAPLETPRTVLSPQEVKARGRRNLFIAVSLLAFVVLVFVITMVRLGANVLNRPI